MLDMKYISKMILFHRKAAGVSRIELADLAGVGKTVIYDIEHGKETVRFDRLNLVLRTLNISAQWTGPLMTKFEALWDDEQVPEEDSDA
jgi:HTH-type transcriptional regulator / antitoxin HipB